MKTKHRICQRAVMVAIVATTLIASSAAHAAATYYWDNNSTTAAFGTASGTWGSDNFWNSDSTGANGGTFATSSGTADSVNFGTASAALGAGTVAVTGSAQGFGDMAFGSASGAVTLSGGTINLAASSTVTVNNASNTISSVLAGSGSSLTKAGTGTLTFSGANTYTGGTTISNGALKLGNGGNSRGILGDITVNSGATLAFTNYNQLGAAFASSAPTNTVTVNNGGNLSWTNNVEAFNNLTLNNVTLTLNGGFTTGWGAMGIGDTLTGTGTASIVAGTGNYIFLSPGASTGAKTLTVAVPTASDALAIAVPIQNYDTGNTYALTKTGSGTLTLSGANTYTGTTTVSGGRLSLGHATNTLADTGAVNVSGGTLDIGANSDTVGTVTLVSGAITGSGGTLAGSSYGVQSGGISAILGGSGVTLTKTTTGTVTLSGANTYTGSTTVSGGTLDVTTGGVINGGAITVGNVGGSTGTLTLSGGSVTSATNAHFMVGTASTAPGVVTVNSGSLNIGGATAQTYIGTGATGTLSINGGTVNVAVGGTGGNGIQYADVYLGVGVDGTLNLNSGGLLSTARDIKHYGGGTGTLNFNGGTLQAAAAYVSNGGGFVNSLNAIVQAGGAVIDTGANNVTISVALTHDSGLGGAADGGLAKIGSGALTLSAADTFTGGVTINAGTLKLNNAGALNSTAGSENAVAFGAGSTGVLTLNGYGVTIANLATDAGTPGTTYVENNLAGTATLTVGNSQNLSGTYAGVIRNGAAGALALAKAGTGTLTLSGANIYSGTTTVSGGTLKVSNNLAFQNSALDTSGAGVITLDTGITTPTIGGLIGSKNLDLVMTTGYSSVTALTLNPGSGTLTYSGVIGNGAMGLIKSGAGTQTLSGINTYTGGTTISNGALKLGNGGNSRGILGDITVNSGATLAFTNYNQLGAAFASSAPTNTVTVNNGGNLSWTNNVEAFNNLTLNNVTLTLNGGFTTGWGAMGIGDTLTGTGTASIVAGTGNYIFLSPGASTGAKTLTVAVPTASDALAIAVPIQNYDTGNTYALTKTGSGTLTLSGANTYTGGTTISQGTVGFSGSGTVGSTSGPLTVNGGALDLSGTTQTVGNLTGSGGTILNNTNATNVTFTIGSGNTGGGTFQGVIADHASGTGTVALAKTGTGIVTLSGANTYTGGTTISGGTLQLGSGGTAGSLSTGSTITNNGVLAFNRSDTVTQGSQFSGSAITGSGGLAQIGSGAVILNAANAYSGATTVSGGTLTIDGAGALTSGGGITVTGSGSVMNINGGYTNTNSAGWVSTTAGGTLNLHGTAAINGNGTSWAIAGNAGAGIFNVTGGSLGIANSNTSYGMIVGYSTGSNGALNISGGTVSVTSGDPFYVGYAATSAVGNVNVSGTGALNIGSGGNVFFGGTNGGSNGGAGNLTISDSGSVTIGAGVAATLSAYTYLGAYSGGGTINLNGGTLNTARPIIGRASTTTFNFSGGTFQAGASTTVLGPDATLIDANGTSVYYIANAYVNGGGAILDSNGYTANITQPLVHGGAGTDGGVTKIGAGTMVLDGANTYNGGTNVSAGTLKVSGTLGATTGAVYVANAATLDLGGSIQTTGAVTLAGGTLANGQLNGSSYAVTGGAISTALTGSGVLTKTGGGSLTLSGASSYTGGTTLSAGAIVVGANATVGTSIPSGYKIVTVGDSITYGAGLSDRNTKAWAVVLQNLLRTQMGNSNVTVVNYGESATTAIYAYGNRLNAHPYYGTATYNNAIASNPNAVVIQLGTNDTYFTDAEVNASFVNNLTTIVNNFKATANHPSIYLCLPPEIYPGSFQQNETRLDLIMPLIQQVASATGATVINNHTMLENEATLFPDSLHPRDQGAQLIGQNVYASLASTYFSNGPLGTGTVTLSGGTLSDDGTARTLTNSLAITGNVTLASSGSGSLTFDPTGLATPSTVTITNSPTITVNNSTTIKEAISGSGFTKTGTGTLTLAALNNTYTAGTTISQGVLEVPTLASEGTPSPIGTGPLTLSGGTLRYTGTDNLTLTGRTIALTSGTTSTLDVADSHARMTLSIADITGGVNANLMKNGLGLLALSGGTTAGYGGTTTVLAGTLTVSGKLNNDLTVNNGATFSPGNSPGYTSMNGVYLVNAGGVHLEEINGPTQASSGTPPDPNTWYDFLEVLTGSVHFEDGSRIDVALDPSYHPATGTIFEILRAPNIYINPYEAVIVNGGGLAPAQYWKYLLSADNQHLYLVVAVPEPGTAVLLGIGMLTALAVVGRRRLRRKQS